jgi:predicted SnoaL-like aldol condensation-catalyzing enzyme
MNNYARRVAGRGRSQRRFAGALLAACLLSASSAPTAEQPCAGDRSLDRNKALVGGFFRDVFGARSVEAAPRYLRPDYIQHSPGIPGGLAGFQEFLRAQFANASASVRMEILHSIAVADLVNVHLRLTGTTVSGKSVDVTEFDLLRVENGLIAEHRDETGLP